MSIFTLYLFCGKIFLPSRKERNDMQTIQVNNIKANYGLKNILADVSFSANAGECVGILGYNGCGKSTLLSILSGINKAKNGEIEYLNKKVYSKKDGIYLKNDFSKIVGYVPQENPLIPELSVYSNLQLWFSSKKELDENLENGFLHQLGIHNYIKKNVNQLSGGMKKRISIGIATINNPKILILDEPSAALDLACKEDIKKYLSEYLSKDNNVIITTHEDSELELCNKIYVIKDGVSKEVDHTLRGNRLVETF